MLTTIPDEFALFIAHTKSQKEDLIARVPPDQPADLVPRAAFFRDDELVAAVFADAVNRDRGLQLIQLGASGYSADYMETVFDTMMTDTRFVQAHGRPPDPREMQEMSREECNGIVTDALLAQVTYRSGRDVFCCLAYHLHETSHEVEFLSDAKARKARRTNPNLLRRNGRWYHVERSVHWLEDMSSFHDSDDPKENEYHTEGYVAHVMREAINRRTYADTAIAEGLVTEPISVEDRIMLDHAVTTALVSLHFMVLAATSSDGFDDFKKRMASHDNIAVLDEHGNPMPLDRSNIPIETRVNSALNDRFLAEVADAMIHDAQVATDNDYIEAMERRAERVNDEPSPADRARAAEWFARKPKRDE